MSRKPLVYAALLIGFAVSVGQKILFELLTGTPVPFEIDVEVFTALFIAVPFLLLALKGIRRLLPWAVGLALTLSVWGYSVYRGVSYAQNPDGSGVDLGLAMFIFLCQLFISPLVLGVHALQQGISSRT